MCIARLGVVLGKNGSALEKMITPFKFGLGSIIGNGKQIMSWIHIDDVINIFNLFIENIYYCVNGFTCSVLCDIITNPLRVVKLKKQTSNKSYYNCIRQIYNNYNFNGFYRGFHTRLLYQGIQNSLFVLLWKNLEKLYL